MKVDREYDFFDCRPSFEDHSDAVSSLIFGIETADVPEFSFFVPTYLRAVTLKETVDSILSMEGAHSYEILVVDNNPQRGDETELLMAGYSGLGNLRYYKNSSNIGMVGNWNRGYHLSRGRWVVMVHDDDLVGPDFLNEVSSALQKVDADALFSRFTPVRSASDLPSHKGAGSGKLSRKRCSSVWNGNDFNVVGSVLRREAVVAVGGFREDQYPCADYGFFTRMAFFRKAWMLDSSIAFYRVSENESLKQETLDGFMHVCHFLRIQILEKLRCPAAIARFVQLYNDRLFEHTLADFWNPSYQCEEFGKPGRIQLFLSKSAYRILSIVFKIEKSING